MSNHRPFPFAGSGSLHFEPLEDRRLLAFTPQMHVELNPFGMSDVTEMMGAGDVTFLAANDGVHGVELWRTDGSANGTFLVKDIVRGASGSDPFGFTDFNGTLLFFLRRAQTELWRSDGTDAGTVKIADMPSASVEQRRVIDNLLYFVGNNGSSGDEVWISDGTANGTRMLKDIAPGSSSSRSGPFAGFQDKVYFSACATTVNCELWTTDGTAAGTVLLRDIRPDAQFVSSSYPQQFTVVGGTLFFTADNGSAGSELWKTDGTAAGTVLVKDTRPGFVSGYLNNFVEVGGLLYFTGGGAETLWRSDGTTAGTMIVSGAPVNPGSLTNLNGALLFAGATNALGRELWHLLPGGSPQLVTEIWPGAAWGLDNDNGYQKFATMDDFAYFSAEDGISGRAVWRSDGTAAGTSRVGGAEPRNLRAFDSQLYWLQDRSNRTSELWTSDGGAGQAGQVFILGGPNDLPSNPTDLTVVGERLFFTTNSPYHNLWATGKESTSLVRIASTSYAETGDYFDSFHSFKGSGGRLYFTGSREQQWWAANEELFASDGTVAGTALVKDIDPRQYFWCDEYGDCDLEPTHFSSNPADKTDVNGTLFFSANEYQYGRELWKSDGTDSGTVVVKDINPGSFEFCEPSWPYDCYNRATSSNPEQLTAFQNQLFFTALSNDLGRELWISDGTADGTQLLRDIRPGLAESAVQILSASMDFLFFSANDGVHGAELWRSDGTAEGTLLVKNIRSGAASARFGSSASLGHIFYFATRDDAGNLGLWKTSGAADDATRVRVFPGVTSIQSMTTLAGKVYLVADRNGAGMELWSSDGSDAGTVLLHAFAGDIVGTPLNLGGNLFFAADDGVHGMELWGSDGTAAGTMLIADIRDGSQGSAPAELTALGDTLFFSADNGLYGRELWNMFVGEAANAPPSVQGVFSLNREVHAAERLSFPISELVVAFGTELVAEGDASILDLAHWRLTRDGMDISSHISQITFGYNPTSNRYEARLALSAPIASGQIVLKLSDAVTDLAGIALDGDRDGQQGGDFSISFSVETPSPLGAEFRINTFTSGDQRGFPTSPGQIAMFPDGGFVVTWSSVDQEGTGDEIYFQRYSATGLPIGLEIRANSVTLGSQRNSTVTALANGQFAIAWNSDHIAANNYDIYARRFDASGTPLGAEFLVHPNVDNSVIQRSPIVVGSPSGQFAVVWHGPDAASNGIYAKVFQPDGAPVGRGIIAVNQFTAGQQQIKAAALHEGRLIVVWQSVGQDGDAGGIYARIFDWQGLALTNEILVPQLTAGDQQNPTVAVDDVGGFVVTWTSDAGGESGADIHARRFDNNGAAISNEFVVNETSAGQQRYSTVSLDADGDVLVTWSSQAQDGDGYGVYARRFNRQNLPEGHEFRVNSFTAGNQLYSNSALDDDGDFVVVWSSLGQDGSGYGLYGQRFGHAPARRSGDADGDGDVDLDDLNAVRNNFGGSGPTVPGDTNEDGFVNLDDLNAVRNNFGAVASPMQRGAVALPAKKNSAVMPIVTRAWRQATDAVFGCWDETSLGKRRRHAAQRA